MPDLHHIKIVANGLHPFLTETWLDGKKLDGVVSLTFHADTKVARLELLLVADLEIEGDAQTVIRVLPHADAG